MPRDPNSKQLFEDEHWNATSSDPEAGKVFIAGAGSGVGFGFAGNSTPTTFSLTATGWTTIHSAPGASTITELRMFAIGNMSTILVRVDFAWNTRTGADFHQPLAANGGAFNHNMVGGYIRGGTNEQLRARLSTTVNTVYGVLYTTDV